MMQSSCNEYAEHRFLWRNKKILVVLVKKEPVLEPLLKIQTTVSIFGNAVPENETRRLANGQNIAIMTKALSCLVLQHLKQGGFHIMNLDTRIKDNLHIRIKDNLHIRIKDNLEK